MSTAFNLTAPEFWILSESHIPWSPVHYYSEGKWAEGGNPGPATYLIARGEDDYYVPYVANSFWSEYASEIIEKVEFRGKNINNETPSGINGEVFFTDETTTASEFESYPVDVNEERRIITFLNPRTVGEVQNVYIEDYGTWYNADNGYTHIIFTLGIGETRFWTDNYRVQEIT